MAGPTAGSQVLRVVVPGDLKAAFARRCEERSQGMSERVRQLIVQDLREDATPAAQLREILASAHRKVTASGLPEPTIEDIDAFIEQVRSERISQGLVS